MLFSKKKEPEGFLRNSATEMKEAAHENLVRSSIRVATDTPKKYSHEDLENAYSNSALLRKICDKPGVDALAKWRKWNAEAEDVLLLTAEEKRLNVRAMLTECYQKRRQFGGCTVVIHIEGQDSSEPLDFNTIKQGGISHLQIVERNMYDSIDFEADFGNPNHNKPTMFKLNSYDAEGKNKDVTYVHPSRMVVMTGERGQTGFVGNNSNIFWGNATIASIIDSVNHWDSFRANIAIAGDKFANPILYVANLTKKVLEQNAIAAKARAEAIAETEKTGTTVKSKVIGGVRSAAQMFNAVCELAGITGTMILEKDNMAYEILPYNFAGLDPVLEKQIEAIATLSGIPLTILSGKHQPGLGNSGAGDIVNYNKMIAGIQRDDIEPNLINLDKAIIMSALGQNPDDLAYIWEELSEVTQLDRSAIFRTEAESIRGLVQDGLMEQADAEKAIAKLLIESGLSTG